MQQIENFITSKNTYRFVFWIVIGFMGVFILMSYPMMKTRFDIWFHLGNIDDLVRGVDLQYGRSAWYRVWATILRFFDIQDIRQYATIIHRTQFIISCASIYLAAAYLLPALLQKKEQTRKNQQKNWISSFALTSTLVWLTVIGTVSTFQQAWIMWYSVNYQITLPFFFLAIGLLLNAIAVNQSLTAMVAKLAISLTLFLLVVLFHAGEFVYIAIYAFVALIVFPNKKNAKKIILALSLIVVIILIASRFYNDRIPEIFTLLQTGQAAKISDLIQEYGKYNIEGGNRYEANWNALYAVCVFCALPIFILHQRHKDILNSKVLYIVLASLAYCFIPTFKFSSGLASLFYGAPIVNRIYFASLLFILPALLTYLILSKTVRFNHPIYLLLLVFGLMGVTAAYSRYINHGGTYFENINSIRKSLKLEKVGIDLTPAELDDIKMQIDAAKRTYKNEDIMYCANFDKSHIIQYVYRQKNILFDRFVPHEIADCANNSKVEGKRIVYIE
jgi:hypothetical protein